MSDNKGILTSAQESKFAELLDKVVKVGGLLEFIDGYIFKALITFLDDKYADKLAVEIKEMLSKLIDAVLNEDVEGAEQIATDIINKLVDIPVLDEEAEGLLFKGVIEMLVGAVLKWVEGKKGEAVYLDLAR